MTTGIDNFGPYSQGGGLGPVAQEASARNQRQSGLEAARGRPPSLPPSAAASYFPQNSESTTHNNRYSISNRPPTRLHEAGSSQSGFPLAAGAATPGSATPYTFSHASSSRHSMRSLPQPYYAMGPVESYDDSPYQRPATSSKTAVDDAHVYAHDIVDDGDDGFMPEPKRKSMLPLNRERSRKVPSQGGAAVGGVAAAGAGAGMLGGLLGRKEKNISSSGSYDPVSNPDLTAAEKSEWLAKQSKRSNRMRWLVGLAIGAVVVLAVIAGIVGGVLSSDSHSSSGGSGSDSTNNAATDASANGDLDLNSAEIKALMNNKNLHKVFPGMDYTPWGVQYPECMIYPPSQNNVTRDMAVLSQLTNAVRLYGTDCNATEMVLHAIDRLQLNDMKVWLGVWIDPNQTTTDRQVEHMYKLLADTEDRSIFKGVIIGNEALFRADQDKAEAHAQLVAELNNARANFSSLGYDLSVSTSDLGDNWDASLAAASDFVMSNVHPFFAGVNVEDAAAWTWDFWQSHDVVLTGKVSNNVIAETGWPSGGGTDCGNDANVCAAGQTGSVASVENMNIFMADWVCQALENGTNYFWFEAFDEAWKVLYNEVSRHIYNLLGQC